MMSTFEIIKQIIIDNITSEDIKPESNFKDDLGCDSLDKIEIIIETEKQFNISISDEKLDDCNTIQDLVNVVDNN